MTDSTVRKVGIISCSGEELCEGTISRVATRMVLEKLRPGQTVTLCLPLFLAGGEGERNFAKHYPTIAVDGCGKLCAAKATATYSAEPAATVVVTEVAKRLPELKADSRRRLGEGGMALAAHVAEEIAARVDALLAPEDQAVAPAEVPGPAGEPSPEGDGRVLVFPCSGASNVGQLTNAAAVELTKQGKAGMDCLAGIGAHVAGMVASAAGASCRIALDGCGVACARKTLEQAGLKVDKAVVVTQLGVTKDHGFEWSYSDLDRVLEAVTAGIPATAAAKGCGCGCGRK